jgi:hypothetical protein
MVESTIPNGVVEDDNDFPPPTPLKDKHQVQSRTDLTNVPLMLAAAVPPPPPPPPPPPKDRVYLDIAAPRSRQVGSKSPSTTSTSSSDDDDDDDETGDGATRTSTDTEIHTIFSQSNAPPPPPPPSSDPASISEKRTPPTPPPPPTPDEDLPFDFHRFLSQLRHRSADPVARFLRSFLAEFAKKQWTVQEQGKIVSDFLHFIYGKMETCEVWRGVGDVEMDNAREGMEKLVMNRLYTQTFSPEIPLPQPYVVGGGSRRHRREREERFPGRRGQHMEDTERDEVLAQ